MVQPNDYGKEMHFIVMDNTFTPEFEIHERYDLKGSTVGRCASNEEKDAQVILIF